jgi:hypothetical protein
VVEKSYAFLNYNLFFPFLILIQFTSDPGNNIKRSGLAVNDISTNVLADLIYNTDTYKWKYNSETQFYSSSTSMSPQLGIGNRAGSRAFPRSGLVLGRAGTALGATAADACFFGEQARSRLFMNASKRDCGVDSWGSCALING